MQATRNPSTPRMVVAAAAIAVVAFAVAACGSDIGLSAGGDGGGGGGSPVGELPAGLVQTVSVAPESPTFDGDIVVRSVIRNEGAVSMEITTRICGLNWGGNLRLVFTPGVVTCGGYSQTTSLAVGDSVVSTAYWRVRSQAGEYTLFVGQLLSPSTYVRSIPITVQ